MYRFITEYANHQKREVGSNSLMDSCVKSKLIGYINGCLRAYKHGFITVDECMRLLAFDGMDMTTGERYQDNPV